MSKEKSYKVTEGERLNLRLSNSGKGVYITNMDKPFGLRGNFEHVKAVLKGQKDFAVLEVVEKEDFKTPERQITAEDEEEEW